MTLWLRLLLLVLTLPFQSRVRASEGVSQRRRVLPSDVDLNFHMTNSRYASFADLARLGLMVRTGLLTTAFRNGWRPMLMASKIRFRRELKPFQSFRVESRLRWWNETSAIFEIRFVGRARDGGDMLAANLLERGVFYCRKDKRFVPVTEVLAAMGAAPGEPPEPTPEIAAFARAEEEMRKAA